MESLDKSATVSSKVLIEFIERKQEIVDTCSRQIFLHDTVYLLLYFINLVLYILYNIILLIITALQI